MASSPRAAKPSELGQTVELVDDVFRQGKERTMGDQFPLLFSPDNAENVRVIEEDGRIISHIGMWFSEIVFNGVRAKSASIGAVCTRSDCRGRGLGTSLLMDAFRHARDNGVDIITISGSRGLYTSNSCRKVGLVGSYKVGEADIAGGGTEEYSFRIGGLQEIDTLINIYSAEPVRYRRTFKDFARAIPAAAFPRCFDYKQEITIVSQRGRDVAYVIAMFPPSGKPVTVFEYAGDRRAVIKGVRAIAESRSSGVDLTVPAWDATLTAQLAAIGVDATGTGPQPGTHYITEPKRLMRTLLPYMLERLGDSEAHALSNPECYGDGGLTWTLGSDTFTLPDREAVTDFVFGAESGIKGAEAVEIAESLSKLLSRVFPLPLPWPETLNYI